MFVESATTSFTDFEKEASYTQPPLEGLVDDPGAVYLSKMLYMDKRENLGYIEYNPNYPELHLPGCLFVVEGVDGAGKSTLIDNWVAQLAKEGHFVCRTREPTRTNSAKYIRAMLQDPRVQFDPLEELASFELDRTKHMLSQIIPLLLQGAVIICDRFTWSTEVLQSDIAGIPLQAVQEFNNLATFGVQPDLTIVLDLPVEKALQRKQKRREDGGDFNKNDEKDRSYVEASRSGFLSRAENNAKAKIINANQPPDKVLSDVITAANSNSTVRRKLRKPALKLPNPTAAAVLFTEDSIVLVRNKDPHKDQRLGFPGGKPLASDNLLLESGKTWTAWREAREETGLPLRLTQFSPLPQRFGAIMLKGSLQIATLNPYLYLHDINPAQLKNRSEVTSTVVPIKDISDGKLDDDLLPNVREVITDALAIRPNEHPPSIILALRRAARMMLNRF